ncbi:MAG: cation:proton antiporter [Anaerolineaceae bacterium]|nr:cation:proton antiporter [Anaerolineaceae bacterium]
MAVLVITPLISESIRLPGIVGLIIGGILVGPHGLGWLKNDIQIELLSTIGLLYLMFSAGLEVDIHQFKRVRTRALIFGLFTFLIPQIMGIAFGRWLGLNWLGAILLGSAFSSHTLIAFPILTRLGIVKNEAISVTVGATVITDIAAFVILAVVLSLQDGALSPVYFVGLFAGLGVYAALILLGLPRLGKIFFRRFHGQAIEFQFVILILFVSALLAELIGVHAVVGAFLAGLAINSTLPHHSAITSRVLFVGEALFIPIFLVHSGMITDPRAFFTNGKTILIGLGVTVIAYTSKFIAAWIVGRLFKYSKAETMTVWGLSQAQAAVTIPTLVLGLEVGLFDDNLFNAAIMMILMTSITSPLIVQHFGRGLKPAENGKESSGLFDRVLVSVANPDTQENLIALASLLAHNKEGTLLALNVAQEVRGQVIGLDHQRQLLERVPQLIANPDAQVELVRRVNSSFASGILRASIEKEATSIILGWRGQPTVRQSIFGTVLDEVVWKAKVPVLVGRITTSINAIEQVTLAIPQEILSSNLTTHTLELALVIAQEVNVPLLVLVRKSNVNTITKALKQRNLDLPFRVEQLEGETVRAISSHVTSQSLLIVTEMGTPKRYLRSLGSIPERLTQIAHVSLLFVHYPTIRHRYH